jgi:hypothetical protein
LMRSEGVQIRFMLDEDYPGWHHARFPRTRPGLERFRKALVALAADPPAGLGEHPVVWWLADASG